MKPAKTEGATTARHRVVIVGAGFAGLSAAKALKDAPVEVTLVDRHNYHLFQPLLYQVATAALSPADIAWPVRSILKAQKNVRVLLNRVTGIDGRGKRVLLASGAALAYDTLILATGAQHSYFGRDAWAGTAPGLKTIDDATEIRRRILSAFEAAENEMDEARRHALLTFVVVGAGPTGVEMAGAIAELARHSIAADFRSITPRCARILLIEAGERVLPAFAPDLSRKAAAALTAMGVEVKLSTRVEDVTPSGVRLNGVFTPARTTVWAAGVKASPAGEWLGAMTDRTGRVVVGEDFSVPGWDGVYVVGDTAAYTPKGAERPLPGLAPVAKQQGDFVGRLVAARLQDRTTLPFQYADYGIMATIGRARAIAEMGRMKASGFPAWLLWSVAHVYFLIGVKNRLAVSLSWAWSYFTYQRGVRLITGPSMSDDTMKEAA